MADEKLDYSAPALEKGLDILELLAPPGRPMGTRQIAEELGRSKNEIFRMVHVLLRPRLHPARRERRGADALQQALRRSGMQTARARDLVSTAAPIVERFAEEVHQAAHLVVAHRGETVIIAAASGGADMNFSLKLGYRRPLGRCPFRPRSDGLPAEAGARPDDRRKPDADARASPTRRRSPLNSTGCATEAPSSTKAATSSA